MRWINRLLSNNYDNQARPRRRIGVKATSVQASGEERSIHFSEKLASFSGLSGQKMVFQLLAYRQKWLI